MRRLGLLAFFGMALAVAELAPAPADAQALFTVQVPPGKVRSVRLRNLPKGAVVSVGVRTSGNVVVAFLDTADARRYPALQHPLFLGRVERRLSFAVTTPEEGTYYVVFHNRSEAESRAVTVSVNARRRKPPERTPEKTPPL